MIKDETLNEIVGQTLAKQILESITQEHRDAILKRSIYDSLRSFEIRKSIESVVAQKALEATTELLSKEEYKNKMQAVVMDAFNVYIQALPEAIMEVILEAFHGKGTSSNFERKPGAILQTIKEVLGRKSTEA